MKKKPLKQYSNQDFLNNCLGFLNILCPKKDKKESGFFCLFSFLLTHQNNKNGLEIYNQDDLSSTYNLKKIHTKKLNTCNETFIHKLDYIFGSASAAFMEEL